MQRFAFLLSVLGLAGCSSHQAVYTDNALQKNSYYLHRAEGQGGPDIEELPVAYALFAEQNDAFYQSLAARAGSFPTLFALPPVTSHGDFHPLTAFWAQDENERTQPVWLLSPLTDTAPWWVDLVRWEAGAWVLAQEQSIKTYSGGACLQAYHEGLAAYRLSKGRSTPTQGTAAKPLDEIQRGNVRVPSLGEKGRDVLAVFAKEGTPPRPWCERLNSAKSVFQGDYGPPACQAAVAGWKAPRGKPLILNDFKNETTLTEHARWMCTKLATRHAQSWDEASIRGALILLERNPLIKKRLLQFAKDEAGRVLEAQKMMIDRMLQ